MFWFPSSPTFVCCVKMLDLQSLAEMISSAGLSVNTRVNQKSFRIRKRPVTALALICSYFIVNLYLSSFSTTMASCCAPNNTASCCSCCGPQCPCGPNCQCPPARRVAQVQKPAPGFEGKPCNKELPRVSVESVLFWRARRRTKEQYLEDSKQFVGLFFDGWNFNLEVKSEKKDFNL